MAVADQELQDMLIAEGLEASDITWITTNHGITSVKMLAYIADSPQTF